MITPTMNWSGVTTPTFTFKYRRDVQYLSSLDRVFIDASTDNGTSWTEIAGPYNRPTDIPGTTYWQDISVNVSTYVSQTSVKFAFRAISEYGNWIHVDNVFIGQPAVNDVGITTISAPGASIFRTAQTITASVKNFGSANQTTYNVHVKTWKTVGGSEGSPEFHQMEAGPAVTAGSTVPFSFATQWTPLEYGGYTVKVYTELGGDETPANDAMTKSVTVLPATDLQITAVVYPPTTGLYTGTLGYGVRGTVKNNGTSIVAGADYTVEAWIGLTSGFPGTATYHGTAVFKPDIAPGASVNVDMLQSWVPADPGAHTVRIKVTLAGDEIRSNDSLDAARMVNSVHVGGPDAGGYYYITNGRPQDPKPIYNWIDITSIGTALNLADDGNSAAISIPGFTLYGTTYTQLKVNNNGLIRFDTGPDLSYYSNLNIPNTVAPDFLLAPFWDDLAPGSATGGNVYYYNDVSNSWFIIEYYQIAMLGEEANPNTFEVVINYATNSIFFQYSNMPGNKSACTIGVEGNGTEGTQWLYNGTPTPAVDALVNGRVIWFGTDTANVPLPIQLSSFTAAINYRSHVQLDWVTLTEVNNYGFEIQKSPGQTSSYQTIPNSFVPGHGTTNVPQYYSYTDSTTTPGVWYYRLKQIDLDGTIHFTDAIQVGILTSVEELAPREFALFQNYPNPFNPATEIRFSVETSGKATLEVYNIIGQKVATVFDDIAEAGRYYKVKLDASNLASGIYIYK
ncbi:MAG: T9SS type A sorting domain-containing protein, partial [Bacteroidota bacterium]